tara:strand:- start:570 stop:1046 length:477 start_codon:yes stop_codon:yes gene_type:complete
MRYRYIYLSIVSFLFLGCHLFESTKVPSKEIKSASSWSEKDQGPNFSECDDFENDQEKKDCFESIISNSILDYLDQNPLESNESISEEINIVLKIDKEGYFSLEEFNGSNKIDEAIPTLKEQLEIAVSLIPQAQPAVKTNVGTFVSTRLSLPIMITAE